jgi:HlyD family secretion protein
MVGVVGAPLRLLAAGLAAATLAGCGEKARDAWQGYVEGEFVALAAPYAGQLLRLHVHRGDQASAGQPVFALEQENERAARLEAEERLRTAEARLANLQARKRPDEIAALRAELKNAHAALALSTTQLTQQRQLYRDGYTSAARLDEANSAYERDRARVAEAEAQVNTSLLPIGRDAERKAAEGEVAAARAALAQAAWRQDQKNVAAPVTGLVQDTFFVEGEWVPAGRPVASLLPPGNVKLRFYVSEAALQSLPPGREVQIGCDGCSPVAAKVIYVSSQAEYTPPVLYSKESRHKLMYLIEARPAPGAGKGLRPGQPVDVRLR